MKLFLDDFRTPPDKSWVLVTSADEAIEILKTNQVTHLSLDHDLGMYVKTGYDVACFIEQAAHDGTLKKIPNLFIHSANPIGAARIAQALAAARQSTYWLFEEMSQVASERDV